MLQESRQPLSLADLINCSGECDSCDVVRAAEIIEKWKRRCVRSGLPVVQKKRLKSVAVVLGQGLEADAE